MKTDKTKDKAPNKSPSSIEKVNLYSNLSGEETNFKNPTRKSVSEKRNNKDNKQQLLADFASLLRPFR